MPTISIFYGIIIRMFIRMFFDEHAPPRFHVQYGEFKASITIDTLDVLDGKLPRRALELVLDWTELHRKELLENWTLCRDHHQPNKITPLE